MTLRTVLKYGSDTGISVWCPKEGSYRNGWILSEQTLYIHKKDKGKISQILSAGVPLNINEELMLFTNPPFFVVTVFALHKHGRDLLKYINHRENKIIKKEEIKHILPIRLWRCHKKLTYGHLLYLVYYQHKAKLWLEE